MTDYPDKKSGYPENQIRRKISKNLSKKCYDSQQIRLITWDATDKMSRTYNEFLKEEHEEMNAISCS